jgi:hypothetical protein
MRITIELTSREAERLDCYRQYILSGTSNSAERMRQQGYSLEEAAAVLLGEALWRHEYLRRLLEPDAPAAPVELPPYQPTPIPQWLVELEREVNQ